MPANAIHRRKLTPWEGRIFLTVGRALYLGPAGDTTAHAHHALQVCVGLEAPVRLRGASGRWREFEAVLVPPDVPHQLDANWAPVLLLYLEPESNDGSQWLRDPRRGVRALDGRTVEAVRSRVRGLAAAAPQESDLEVIYTGILESVGLPTDARVPTDPRVAEAIRRLRESHALHRSLGELARELALSPSRFRHLFRREIGMSTQSYVVWLRIYDACAALARGRSLSQAALEAGFSDAAHFTRSFRRTFGLAPSQVASRLELLGGAHSIGDTC